MAIDIDQFGQRPRQRTFAEICEQFREMGRIPASEWEEFRKLWKLEVLRKGECFIRYGEPCPDIGLIETGLVKVCYPLADGTKRIRNFCAEGDLIASFSDTVAQVPASVSIEALEPTTIYRFAYGILDELFESSQHWQRLGLKVFQSNYLARERREFLFLTADAAARYASFADSFPDIKHRITQSDIAAYIGVTPEALCRLLKAKRPPSTPRRTAR